MDAQLLAAGLLGAAGVTCAALAVRSERRMQRYRQPGVSYGAVTLRRDGGWRRADLFTPEGLRHQKRASQFAITATGLWLLALAAWVGLAV